MSEATPAGVVPAPVHADGAPRAHGARPTDAPFAGAVGAIWLRELRGRMRGKRAFLFITFYLVFLATILWIGLRGVTESPFFGAVEQVGLGRGLFTTVFFIEILVIVALAPAYTAGSISQEREKQTFDLLAVTPVSSLAIVVGKLLSGLSYLVLVVGVSLPMASVAFFFGGIDVDTVLLAYLFLGAIAVGVGAIGVACSAAMRRTQPATVASFMLVAVVVVGLTAVWVVMTERARFEGRPLPPEALIWLNPFLAGADLLCSTTDSACLPGVSTPLPIFDQVTGAVVGQGADAPAAGRLWPRSLVAWIVVTTAALVLASQSISSTRRWRPGGQRMRRDTIEEPGP